MNNFTYLLQYLIMPLLIGIAILAMAISAVVAIARRKKSTAVLSSGDKVYRRRLITAICVLFLIIIVANLLALTST